MNAKFLELKQKQAEIRKMKQEVLETSNKIFSECAKSIFDEHPKIKSFSVSLPFNSSCNLLILTVLSSLYKYCFNLFNIA